MAKEQKKDKMGINEEEKGEEKKEVMKEELEMEEEKKSVLGLSYGGINIFLAALRQRFDLTHL